MPISIVTDLLHLEILTPRRQWSLRRPVVKCINACNSLCVIIKLRVNEIRDRKEVNMDSVICTNCILYWIKCIFGYQLLLENCKRLVSILKSLEYFTQTLFWMRLIRSLFAFFLEEILLLK